MVAFDAVAIETETARVRLLFLHPRLDLTDSTLRLLASVRAAQRAGAKVTVFSKRGSCSAALSSTGAEILEGELPSTRWRGYFAAGRTAERIAELAPELLHVTDEELAGLAVRLAEGLRCRYVLEISRKLRAPLRLRAPWIGSVILPCDTFVENAVNRGQVPREYLKVIEHGPDPAIRWKPHEEDRRPVVVTCGTLDEAHAQEVLVEAAALLARAGRKLEFLVLGEGPRELDLRRRIRELGLESHITVACPALPALRDALLEADLHVSCARSGSPGWGAIEALGMGIPSVFTAINGSFPLVEDRRNALLVERNSPAKLAEQLAVLLDNHEGALRLGAHARSRLLQSHRHESFARGLAELYEAARGAPAS